MSAPSTVLTPTVRQGTKRMLFWAGALVFALLTGIGMLLLVGAAGETVPLSPESAAPDGTRAIAEVLREQGVDVVVTDSLDDTAAAVDPAGDATILVHDPDQILGDDQRERMLGLTGNLVLLEPSFAELQSLAPGIASAGEPDDDPLEAACDLPAASAAGEVSPGGTAYRVGDGVDAESCLRSTSDGAADAFSLVRLGVGDTTVTVVGATDALTNASVAEYGNAAFALTVLGETDTLVWYLPSAADTEAAGPSAFTPGWLTPVIALLILTLLAAAFWRGRRFGPLIIENLPVVVRASETMEGRARLYQTGSARQRAIDAIRVGTLSRLSTRCGLPATATLDEVISAVAALVGADPSAIRALLVDDSPGSDADLVQLSDRLRELESAAERASRP